MKVFSALLSTLLNDDGKIDTPLPGVLYLWKALLDKHGPDMALLQAIVELFDLADPRELNTQLQLQQQKVVVELLWTLFRSEDRRKRITVG